MPRRKPPNKGSRLDQVEAELADLKAQLAELGVTAEELAELREDVDELRQAVEARGARPNPGPRLSPEVRAARARNIAIARAAKQVGKGQGKVRSTATKRKLQREAAGVKKK